MIVPTGNGEDIHHVDESLQWYKSTGDKKAQDNRATKIYDEPEKQKMNQENLGQGRWDWGCLEISRSDNGQI